MNGVPMAYATAGAGPPTVCLVHGTGGSSDVWTGQLDGLDDLGQMVALDLPGHGRSGGTIPKTIEDAAAIVAGFLDALGIARVVIGGHSMGGAIAQQFALAFRERVDGLVLVGSGARLRVLPRLLALLETNTRDGVDLLMSLAVSAEAPADLRAALHRATADNPPGVVLGDLRSCDAFDVMTGIGKVGVPALVICGADDQLTPPKYSQFLGAQIAGARVVVVPGSGHYVQVEKPRETTAAMRDFLVRLSGVARHANEGVRGKP